MPAETAKAVLANRKFRWSSPFLFNDPFDTQTELRFPAVSEDVFQDYIRELAAIALGGDDEPPEICARIVAALRKERDAGNLRAPDDVLKVLSGARYILDEVINSSIAETNRGWQPYIRRMRVLCVAASDEPRNLLMWSHYASGHKGVALLLRWVSRDGSLAIPFKVIYSAETPTLCSRADMGRFLAGTLDVSGIWMFLQTALTKGDCWAYENEWRFMITGGVEDPLWTDIAFHDDELAAVYLGCCIDANDRDEIVGLCEAKWPGVTVFQVKRSVALFGLEFERL